MTPVPARPRHRLLAAAGVLAAFAAALLLAGTPSAAQQAQDEDRIAASLAMDVTRLDGLVSEDADLRIRAQIVNTGSTDRDDLRVLVTMHRQPIGRFNYQQAMDQGVLADVVHAFTADVGDVPADGTRTVELSQTAAELGFTQPVSQAGVYPLRLQLQTGGDTVDELISNIVYAPADAELPIAVGLLVPVAQPPGRDGQGVFVDDGLIRAATPAGRLGGLVEVLGERPDLPVTLAVDGLTMQEVSDLASGFMEAENGATTARASDSPEAEDAAAVLAGLRDIAARPQVHVLALPYASADLVALERHGLEQNLTRHVTEGRSTLEAALGDRPLRTMLWPPDGMTPRTLARLRDLDISTPVLSERYLELSAPRGARSPAAVRRLRSGQATATDALVPDPWLEQTLAEGEETPALLTQRVLGELATVYFEVPGVGDRGILLAPAYGASLHPEFLAGLADALTEAPFAEPATLATLAERTTPGDDPVRLRYPRQARARELPAAYATELREARRALRSLEDLLVDDQVTPARFDQAILQAASVHYRDDHAAGRALLRTVTDTMEGLDDAVVIPPVPPVTLTSVEGQLPVTIESHADVPLRVLLHLRTASYEIEGGPVRELVLGPDEAEILTFEVRALRPGRTDGVQLLVTDVDGDVELAESTVVVRSTTFSVAGVVVTVGAALFLLAWGIREVARRRPEGAAPTEAAEEVPADTTTSR